MATAAAASRIGSGTAEGTPEEVAKVKESYTGQYLKQMLGRCAGGAHRNGSNARGKKEAAE